MPAPITVVIPTLDAALSLPATADALLEGVTDGLIAGLVISDGGSVDRTRDVARELGAAWLRGPPGRGGQIGRGVAAADTDWVLILHADTWLSSGWSGAARRHMSEYPEKAGYFRLRFRSEGQAPRFVAAGANLRSWVLGLPWGDQGLLVKRRVLSAVGGVPEVPLMEDVALARRLKGRLRMIEAEALTSAERYERDGWGRRVAANLGTLARYAMGVDPEKLAARYRKP